MDRLDGVDQKLRVFLFCCNRLMISKDSLRNKIPLKIFTKVLIKSQYLNIQKTYNELIVAMRSSKQYIMQVTYWIPYSGYNLRGAISAI